MLNSLPFSNSESIANTVAEPESTGWAQLLKLSALPLIDGVFLGFLANDLWKDLGSCISFGATVFGGAGCFSAAMCLGGSLLERVRQVALVYGAVAVGACGIMICQPLLTNLVPQEMDVFTGLFLLGMGLEMTDLSSLRRVASWLGFRTILRAVLVVCLVRGVRYGVDDVRFAFEPQILAATGVTLLAGLGVTLAGLGLGWALSSRSTPDRLLKIGAGTSIVALSVVVIGVPIPTALVCVPVLAALVWTVLTCPKTVSAECAFNAQNENA